MKRYLGDGVYVDVENGMLKLTAENGIEATDTIFLESSVLANLQTYVASLEEPKAENGDEDEEDDQDDTDDDEDDDEDDEDDDEVEEDAAS